MPNNALWTVNKATVEAKLSYATPAWWGFASAADRGRLEAFLRRSATFGYRDVSATSLAHICTQADDKLFNKIMYNDKHLLHKLLPPTRSQHYSLRPRRHNLQLPTRTSAFKNNNFLIRMLYRDLSYSSQSSSTMWHSLNSVYTILDFYDNLYFTCMLVKSTAVCLWLNYTIYLSI